MNWGKTAHGLVKEEESRQEAVGIKEENNAVESVTV